VVRAAHGYRSARRIDREDDVRPDLARRHELDARRQRDLHRARIYCRGDDDPLVAEIMAVSEGDAIVVRDLAMTFAVDGLPP
jgi:hypothetical protein